MVGKQIIEVCTQGCGGVWFEPFQRQRLIEDDPASARAFLRARSDAPIRPVEPGPRRCPRCDLPMLRRMANAASAGHVFECPGCGGQWVDHQDLVRMITEETTEEDREKAAERMFYERFGEPLAREVHEEERS
jgi:uncharacterized protein